MFTLTNAWKTLWRHPWRTLLTILVAVMVTAWSIFGMAVLHEHGRAHNETYRSLVPAAVIRPTVKFQADKSGDDSSFTKHYLSWNDYDKFAVAAQQEGQQFQYSVAESVPVRTTGTLKAITSSSTSDASQDKTGGDLTLQAFHTAEAQAVNEWGDYKIVDGKELNYQSASADKEYPVLVSQAYAKLNNVKVGDALKVANPDNAKKTLDFKVAGIYEYTANPENAPGNNAKYAKDNRENVLYTTYSAFALNGLDQEGTKNWAKPDLNVVFQLSSPKDYEKFKSTVEKVGLPDGMKITSPTIDRYNASLTKLDSTASWMRILLISLWVVGGLLLLLFILWCAIPRREEIGNAMLLGVSKGRLSWQFMLEAIIPVGFGLLLGLLIGGTCSNPLGHSLTGGHATPVYGSLIGNTLWIGALATIVLAIIAMLRVAFFNPRQLFVSPFLSADQAAKDEQDEQ